MVASKDVARAAVQLVLTADRAAEARMKAALAAEGFSTAAVDIGGEFATSMNRVIECAVVAAKREGIIGDTHQEEGAIAGAAHDALSQIVSRALGMNVGGKLAIARADGHVVVSLFFGIGMLHLNEVAISIGHRAV